MIRFNLKYVLLILASMSQTAAAGEFFNVGLRVDLKYESFGESCRLHPLFRHYNLSAEVTDGRVVRAQIAKVKNLVTQNTHPLSDDEMQGLDVRHEKEQSWAKSLVIGPDLLREIILTGDGLSFDDCIPPRDLIFADESPVVFDFGVEEVGYLLSALINSKPVKIRGTKQNGDPFLITLSLTQDRT
jgi:hypothetical protein